MHAQTDQFYEGIATFLGSYYLLLGLVNLVAALAIWRRSPSEGNGCNDRVAFLPPLKIPSVAWIVLTVFFVVLYLLDMTKTAAVGWLVVSIYAAIMTVAPELSNWKVRSTTAWYFFSFLFALLAFVASPLAMSADIVLMPRLPVAFMDWIDTLVGGSTGAIVYTCSTVTGFSVLFLMRRYFSQALIAWIGFNLSLLLLGLAMTDPDFYGIAAKPDNVPIVGLIFLLGFFTWLSTAKAVVNDDRHAQGLPPLEKENNEKVLVWPDLVYTELICMVLLTALLIVWGMALDAPLEEPASAVKTPNPSKAPWYFLGLQEMLVYFDPWMAGVVMPSLVVFGLMAIPYIDYNKLGNGYYSINQRKFAYVTFQFGFLVLWVTLIIMGTFLRGPNWNIFGPFEFWDPHKVEALANVNLSEYFWNQLLGQGLPTAPAGSGTLVKAGYILLREWLGFALTLGYLVLLPPLMAITVFRKFYVRMGFIRFMLMSNLLLFMAMLPIKMILRWTVNMKYVIAIPEFFFNL